MRDLLHISCTKHMNFILNYSNFMVPTLGYLKNCENFPLNLCSNVKIKKFHKVRCMYCRRPEAGNVVQTTFLHFLYIFWLVYMLGSN